MTFGLLDESSLKRLRARRELGANRRGGTLSCFSLLLHNFTYLHHREALLHTTICDQYACRHMKNSMISEEIVEHIERQMFRIKNFYKAERLFVILGTRFIILDLKCKTMQMRKIILSV